MRLPGFPRDGFELAYLAALTRSGLKPVSRWEKAFAGATLDQLRVWGLETRVVRRSLRDGTPTQELIFSADPRPLEEYAAHFDGRPLGPGAPQQRVEGRLFGYPPCCVESFVTCGYARNSLRRSEQRILFHWACPGCRVTPRLLPAYRRVFRDCRRLRFGGGRLSASLAGRRGARVLAATAALVAWGLPLAPWAWADPHVVPLSVAEDADRDGLTTDEETALGGDPTVADEDRNGSSDGVDLAQMLSAAIDQLPTAASPTQPYVVAHLAFGEETCAICGAAVNMGALELVRPLENHSLSVPCIAKHFLEHGSFGYTGSVHTGRLNVPQLRALLSPRGHLPPVAGDTDGDLLADLEEDELGQAVAEVDQNGNQLPDGVDLARAAATRLAQLPVKTNAVEVYRLDFPLRGVERCEVCGEWVNMGHCTVCNPRAALYLRLPYVAFHFLEHGAFAYAGSLQGEDRLDVGLLMAALDATTPAHRQAAADDPDQDGMSAPQEKWLGTDPANADTDGDGVPDGFALARGFWRALTSLPRVSGPRPHVVEHWANGIVPCAACATPVNMGYLDLVSPGAHRTVAISFLQLHYLQHGALAVSAHESVDAADLQELLRPWADPPAVPGRAGLRWFGTFGRRYQVLTASEPAGPWSAGPVFLGHGQELVFEDPAASASDRRFYRLWAW